MLSFEKIRDLERAEHDSRELGKLPENFLDEIKDYLERKEKTADDREIKNIKNTIKRLFEMREKKIFELALYSAKTNLPVDNLMKREEDTFNKLLLIVKDNRAGFLSALDKPKKVEQERTEQKEEQKRTFYKVKKPIKPFMGPDMKVYELKENDVVNINTIPKPLNDLLLKEGVIEKLEK